MNAPIYAVRTQCDGVWLYGTRLLAGLVIELDERQTLAERLTEPQARALAQRMEGVTGQTWDLCRVPTIQATGSGS